MLNFTSKVIVITKRNFIGISRVTVKVSPLFLYMYRAATYLHLPLGSPMVLVSIYLIYPIYLTIIKIAGKYR